MNFSKIKFFEFLHRNKKLQNRLGQEFGYIRYHVKSCAIHRDEVNAFRSRQFLTLNKIT